jgi:hypothetical protein
VSEPLEVASGTTPSTLKCIEATTPLSAIVWIALSVHARRNAWSLSFGSLRISAAGLKFHSVIQIGSSAPPRVSRMAVRAWANLVGQSSMPPALRHASSDSVVPQVYMCQLIASGRGWALVRNVLRYDSSYW